MGNGFDRVRRVPDQRARGLELGGHLCAHVFDRLKARDHAAELRALLGVLDCLIEHGLAGAEGVRRERRAPRVQHPVENARCSTRSPEERGWLDGLETQLRQPARAVDGRESLDLEPGRVRRHQRELALSRCEEHQVRARQSQHHQRFADQLPAIEAYLGALPTGVALGQGSGDLQVAGRELWQPLLLLLGSSRLAQCEGCKHCACHEGSRSNGPAQLFGYQCGVQVPQAAAAMLLGNQDARGSQLGKTRPESVRLCPVAGRDLAHAGDRHVIR